MDGSVADQLRMARQAEAMLRQRCEEQQHEVRTLKSRIAAIETFPPERDLLAMLLDCVSEAGAAEGRLRALQAKQAPHEASVRALADECAAADRELAARLSRMLAREEEKRRRLAEEAAAFAQGDEADRTQEALLAAAEFQHASLKAGLAAQQKALKEKKHLVMSQIAVAAEQGDAGGGGMVLGGAGGKQQQNNGLPSPSCT